MKKYIITCNPVHKDLPKDWKFDIEVEDSTPIEEVRDMAESIIYAEWSSYLISDSQMWSNIIYTYEVEDI